MDFKAYTIWAPAESALSRAQRGSDAAPYGASDYILIEIVNWLRYLDYRVRSIVDKNAKVPDRIYLPGSEPVQQVRRGDAMTIDEMDKRLGWNQP